MGNLISYNGKCYEWTPTTVGGVLTGDWIETQCPATMLSDVMSSGGNCYRWIPLLMDPVLGVVSGSWQLVNCPGTIATVAPTCKLNVCTCLNLYGYSSVLSTDAGGSGSTISTPAGPANPRCPDGYTWGGVNCVRGTTDCSPGYRWNGLQCVQDGSSFDCGTGYADYGAGCVPCITPAAPTVALHDYGFPITSPGFDITITNPLDEEVTIDIYYAVKFPMAGSYCGPFRSLIGPFSFTNNETQTILITKPIPAPPQMCWFQWGAEHTFYYVIHTASTGCPDLTSLSNVIIPIYGTPITPQCATPVITIDGNDDCTITCTTPGADIYYQCANCDGTLAPPILYTGAFPMTCPTIFAYATKSGITDSQIVSGYANSIKFLLDEYNRYIMDGDGKCIIVNI